MLVTMWKNFLHFFYKKFATIKSYIIFETMKQELNVKELVSGHRFEAFLTDQEWEQFESNRQRFSLFPYPIPLSVIYKFPILHFRILYSMVFLQWILPRDFLTGIILFKEINKMAGIVFFVYTALFMLLVCPIIAYIEKVCQKGNKP
jgi:hypothetical protein